jgi:hypothetical protein
VTTQSIVSIAIEAAYPGMRMRGEAALTAISGELDERRVTGTR